MLPVTLAIGKPMKAIVFHGIVDARCCGELPGAFGYPSRPSAHDKNGSAMSAWVRLCAVSDCPPGEGREFVAGDRIIAVFHCDGQFHALDGICPHQGGPLGKGELNGCIVTCPWHGWQFDVTTGKHQTSQSLFHPTFPVKVENGELLVNLGE